MQWISRWWRTRVLTRQLAANDDRFDILADMRDRLNAFCMQGEDRISAEQIVATYASLDTEDTIVDARHLLIIEELERLESLSCIRWFKSKLLDVALGEMPAAIVWMQVILRRVRKLRSRR